MGTAKTRFMHLIQTQNLCFITDNLITLFRQPQVSLLFGEYSMRIKVISFYTEGEPYDGGANLRSGMYTFRQIAEESGYLFDSYTPARLEAMGAGIFSNPIPDEFESNSNKYYHKIGFMAWKSFIIYDALKDMDDGDVVFYLDSNIGKYPSLRNMIKDAKYISNTALENYDFYVGREFVDQSFPLIQFAHREVIDELGKGTDFVKHFPNLIVNNIICRKTRFSEDILLDWMSLCLIDRFLYIKNKSSLQYDDFKWSCPEQSVLNAIIARHIQEGLLPWNYPGICYGRENIPQITDNSHIKYLSHEKYIPAQHRLREEFYAQREKTKLFLNQIYSGELLKKNAFANIPLTEKSIFYKMRNPEENGKISYKGQESEAIIIKTESIKNKEIIIYIEMTINIKDFYGLIIKTEKQDICLIFINHDATLTNMAVDYSVCKKNENNFLIKAHFFTNSDTLEIETRDHLGYFYGIGKCFVEINDITINCREPLSLN